MADWSYFGGGILFVVAIYLELLETINSDPHPKRARRRPDESFRWFAWRPHQLSFLSVFILLVGTLLFNVETTIALLGLSINNEMSWLLSVPSFLGAILYVIATNIQLMETCHSYPCLKPRSISWWTAALYVLGSVGFLSGAFFSFDAPGLSNAGDLLIVKLSYLAGSILFLAGSYLMIPDIFSE